MEVTRSVDAQMLAIQALDRGATLLLSSFTHQWYIQSALDIGDGVILRGITEHHDTPEAAVAAFFAALTAVTGPEEYIAGTFLSHRREWRWNGAAFAECTRTLVFEQEAASA